jgi:hypothetical protein
LTFYFDLEDENEEGSEEETKQEDTNNEGEVNINKHFIKILSKDSFEEVKINDREALM